MVDRLPRILDLLRSNTDQMIRVHGEDLLLSFALLAGLLGLFFNGSFDQVVEVFDLCPKVAVDVLKSTDYDITRLGLRRGSCQLHLLLRFVVVHFSIN